MFDTQLAETTTPRLIKSEYGWWVVGSKRSFLLGPAAVGPDGNLLAALERRMRADGAYESMSIQEYSITVLTATACNLGCGYCFQNTAQDPRGGSRPPRIKSIQIKRNTSKAILEFAAERMAEVNLDKLNLHLFGGEPLLNPRGCRELLELAQGYGLSSAMMTSNGTLLTPVLAKDLYAVGLRNLQVTFDGGRDDHDAIRVRRTGGGGTFDEIVSNIARASEVTPLRWTLQVNVSHLNQHGVNDLLEYVAARVDPARCLAMFTIVTDVGVGYANDLSRGTAFADTVVEWNVRASELGFHIVRPKAKGVCASCSFTPGRFGAVINADGTLYSCWESAGKPGWELGTVFDGYQPAEQVSDRWVACGYDNQSADSPSTVANFRDQVDAGVLDYLYTAGKF